MKERKIAGVLCCWCFEQLQWVSWFSWNVGNSLETCCLDILIWFWLPGKSTQLIDDFKMLLHKSKWQAYFSVPLQQRRRLLTHANEKSKSEKFPPPHQDGTLGYRLGSSHHIDSAFDTSDVPFSSMNFSYEKEPIQTWSGPLGDPATNGSARRKSKPSKKDWRTKKKEKM